MVIYYLLFAVQRYSFFLTYAKNKQKNRPEGRFFNGARTIMREPSTCTPRALLREPLRALGVLCPRVSRADNQFYFHNVYLFIGLLASSTVRISFALRTSTARPFFVCSVPRGIPRFSFFCSPALNAGFSLCIFRASLREPPCPRCPVRASSASAFVLRLLAPHFMRVSLSPISYLLPSTGRSGGAFYVHCAGCHPAA